MKLFFVFSIVCLLSVNKVCGQIKNIQYSIARFIIKDCLNEFDANVRTTNKNLFKQSNADTTCLYACGLRKWSEEKGLTLYKGLLEMIDEAYKTGFHNTKFTRNDVISKVERCINKEKNECELAKCVEIFGPPFSDIYVHYITNYQPAS